MQAQAAYYSSVTNAGSIYGFSQGAVVTLIPALGQS